MMGSHTRNLVGSVLMSDCGTLKLINSGSSRDGYWPLFSNKLKLRVDGT